MKAKWLVELDLFTDIEADLIEAIKKSGREVKTLRDVSHDKLLDKCSKYFSNEDCVVFYGSINFGRRLQKMPWAPGVYLDEHKYQCTSYYPIFGDELVHSNYIMMPFGDLLRRKEFLFEFFGDKLFIRPNSGFKQFTGSIFSCDNFDYAMSIANYHQNIDEDLLIVVSDVKDFIREWRFVIVNGEVVSGSLYRDWTKGAEDIYPGTTTKDIVLLNSKGIKEYCQDDNAFNYAKKVASLYNPESAWTLDVAQVSDNEYKVIEIGCFSCADMYKNDITSVVNSVSKAAEQEWNNYFNIY